MKLVITLVFLFIGVNASAHSGNTDSNGCHNDRINGGYHCHKNAEDPSRELSSEKSETVVFNTKSKKFHRHNCKSAKSCTVNCVVIEKSDAMGRGGVPCGNCGG